MLWRLSPHGLPWQCMPAWCWGGQAPSPSAKSVKMYVAALQAWGGLIQQLFRGAYSWVTTCQVGALPCLSIAGRERAMQWIQRGLGRAV